MQPEVWGCTDLGIQFRRYQIRTCRKDTVEISKLSIFQIKFKTGEERIYGRKDLLLSNFQKPGSYPFLSITLFATMSSQTTSWFLEIKSDLATHRLFPFHQSRIFDSTAEIRKLAQLPTCVDWNWYVCQLTHLDESEQLRSPRVLQS